MKHDKLFALMDTAPAKAVALHVEELKKHMAKIGQRFPGLSPKGKPMTWHDVTEVALHKIRVSSLVATIEQKQASRAWLIERGYRPALPTFEEMFK